MVDEMREDPLESIEAEGAGNDSEYDEASRERDQDNAASEKKRLRRAIFIGFAGAVALCACTLGVIAYGIETALHWEKVDNPGYLETYQTGYYTITMDEVPVCYVGQDWTDCINAYKAEYERECSKPIQPQSSGFADTKNKYLSSFSTVSIATRVAPRNQELCSRYGEMISEMQEQGGAGYYVSSLGLWGHLHSEPVTNERRVGYSSHDAVCYFGFLGECPEEDEQSVGSAGSA